MNLALKIVLFVISFKAAIVFVLLVGATVVWLNGGGSILLPGLGLIIGMPLVIAALLVAEIFLAAMIAFLVFELRKRSHALR